MGGPGQSDRQFLDPNALRAVSDFDTTHQFNANWVYELPFGKGKAFGKSAKGGLDALIGGLAAFWIGALSSGFPVSVNSGSTWSTNWQIQGDAVPTGKIVTKTTKTLMERSTFSPILSGL